MRLGRTAGALAARRAWVLGLLFGLLSYAVQAEAALVSPLQRFDEGIQLSSVSFLAHGIVPIRDAYVPYGPALALPGLPAYLVLGPNVLADRLSFAIVPAAVTALLVVWAVRRSGLVAAVCVGFLALLASVVRYSLPALVVLAFVLALDGVMARGPDRTLAELARRRPGTLVALSAVLGFAAWFRPEYVVVVLVWTAVVAVGTRNVAVTAFVGAASFGVAAAPFVAIAASGGAQHLAWWWEYALVGFRRYRGQPIEWSFPLRWVESVVHGPYDTSRSLLMVSFLLGVLVVAAWVVRLVTGRGRTLRADPTLLAPFLSLVCAYVVVAQSVRFSPQNGAAVLPLVLAALVAWAPRTQWIAVACIAALVVAAPALPNLPRLPADALAAWRANGALPQVAGFERVPLNDAERRSFPALRRIWLNRVPNRSRVFVANLRNDDAEGNEAIMYWYLRSRPAAWGTTYDPGLADRTDVQRAEVAALCRNRAPVVEHTASYAPFASRNHRSRYLDQFLALDYRVVGRTELWRMLVPRAGRCVRPEEASTALVVHRRAQLLRAGELPAAGALGTLLVERSLAARRRPALPDVAGAILGGFWEPDSFLPRGAVGAALAALRDQRPDPSLVAAAAAPPTDSIAALAVQTGFMTLANAGATEAQRRAVLPALRRTALSHPAWPTALTNLEALQPGGSTHG